VSVPRHKVAVDFVSRPVRPCRRPFVSTHVRQSSFISEQHVRLDVARALRFQEFPSGSVLFTCEGSICRVRGIPPAIASCLEYFRLKHRTGRAGVP